MANICTSNLTSGFIDLATYDELEKYMYGGPDATAYFVRQTRKATWFTQVPVILSKASGTPQFNQEWSVQISRAGDYLLYAWLRVVVPAVKNPAYVPGNPNSGLPIPAGLTGTTGGATGVTGVYIGWTPNFMHNLVAECCITFNDLVAATFNSTHLDFWSAFTTPPGKVDGYYQMIGTLTDLTNLYGPGETIPETVLNLPLPFFFARDSGVALPTAALPYNDMRITFVFNDWQRLLNQYVVVQDPCYCNRCLAVPLNTCNWNHPDFVPPVLQTVQVWANYAIVSNDERKRMGCAPRDILIEQVQTTPAQTYAPYTQPNPSYDIRFSHAIKALFFGAKNVAIRSYGSNYTTQHNIPVFCQLCKRDIYYIANYFPGNDPIDTTTLTYENTQRLANMGSDYFSLISPYFNAPVIPMITGYHLYSYALDFISLDPLGSTNFGKLTNVSIAPTPSNYAIWSSSPDPYSDPICQTDPNAFCERYPDFIPYFKDSPQKIAVVFPSVYSFFVTAVNNNIIRVSGGQPKRTLSTNYGKVQKINVPPTVSSYIGCGMTNMEKECNVPLISCF